MLLQLPVTAEQVQTATRQDRVLSQVYRYVQQGWPNVVEEFKPFAHCKQELSTRKLSTLG